MFSFFVGNITKTIIRYLSANGDVNVFASFNCIADCCKDVAVAVVKRHGCGCGNVCEHCFFFVGKSFKFSSVFVFGVFAGFFKRSAVEVGAVFCEPFFNFFNGFRYAVAGYLITYCLNGDVTVNGLIINYTVFMTFGEVTCMIFGGLSPKFTRWVGSKKKAFNIAALICIVFSVAFFFVPMDPAYIWVMVALVVLTSIGVGFYSPLLWSMYADVADYATEKNGTSSTGLIFSSGTMAQKFGSAISGSLVAILLGIAGFISGSDPATGETIITITDQEAVKEMIWLLFSIIPAFIVLVMMFLLHKYPIKK